MTPIFTTPGLDGFNVGATSSLNARAGWGTGENRAADNTLITDAGPTYASGDGVGHKSNIWATDMGLNHEVWFTVGSAADTTTLLLRCSGPNDSPQTSGYMATIGWSGALNIDLVNGGTNLATLAAATFPALAVGDQAVFAMRGSKMEVWTRRPPGIWIIVPGTSLTDTTYPNGRYIGLGLESGSTGRIDTFGGGSSEPTTMPWPNQSYADQTRGVKFG